jgi:hypothetical protein
MVIARSKRQVLPLSVLVVKKESLAILGCEEVKKLKRMFEWTCVAEESILYGVYI